jgi:hypothetical protein
MRKFALLSLLVCVLAVGLSADAAQARGFAARGTSFHGGGGFHGAGGFHRAGGFHGMGGFHAAHNFHGMGAAHMTHPTAGNSARPVQANASGRHEQHASRGGERHGSRNRSAFAVIPTDFLDDGDPLDVDAFIDSIDTSGPLEPVPACTTVPCPFGAMSMADDGGWGGAWNHADIEGARAEAIKNCQERTKDHCGGVFVAIGTAWIAGLQCQRPATNAQWGVMGLGNDLPSAIRNAYRSVAQSGFYAASECAFVGAVAADGSHLKYTQPDQYVQHQ